MHPAQGLDQIVDVGTWPESEMYSPYPEGSRVKRLYSCPSPRTFDWLIEGHKYLFKESSHRYPEQFWIEILAYRIGTAMDISVPPAFVALNNEDGRCAAFVAAGVKVPYFAGESVPT